MDEKIFPVTLEKIARGLSPKHINDMHGWTFEMETEGGVNFFFSRLPELKDIVRFREISYKKVLLEVKDGK